MNASLVIIQGARKARVELKLPTTLGRSRDAALQVSDGLASRNHCEVYEYEGELAVQDLKSLNGTYVNDQKIAEPTLLEAGDVLRIGSVHFRVEVEGAADHVLDDDDLSSVLALEEVDQSEVSPSESVVNYSESAAGSFIGIDSGEDSGPSVGGSAPAFDGVESVKKVDSGDDALNDFFGGLE